MKLTLEDVKKIARGALEVTESEGSFRFHRFEAGAREHYEKQTATMCGKSRASASICLDFLTDSSRFEADFSVSYGSSRGYYYFDVYVDGILRKHLGEENAWIKKGRLSLSIQGGGEHRITLWLPNLANASLSNIELDDGASLKPIGYKKKFLCFGDSITQGYDAAFPSKSYVNRMTAHFDAFTVNQAIGGERFVPEILLEDTSYQPDILTVAYGTNDWSGTKAEYFHPRCEEFFRKASLIYPRALRFALLPIWRADEASGKQKYEGSFDDACAFIAQSAEKHGFTVIDGRGFMPRSPEFYWDGRLHPNDLGFAEYAQCLIAELEKYI